jgi:hypothetical protein
VAERADDPIQRIRDAVHRLAQETRGRTRTGLSHEDADEVAGTIATDSAIGFDPLPALGVLSEHGARVVVVGQVAGIMHGSQELTGDLDLLWDGDARQAPNLAAAFAALGATLTDEDRKPVPCASRSFELAKVIFETPTASGDCCTPRLPWGALDIEGVIRRAGTAVAPDGLTVHYASAPDLITMRRAVGRPKDLRRAAELEGLR